MEQKKLMRSNVRKLKKSYTAQQLQDKSAAATERLKDSAYIKNAQVVMLYYSLPDEVYTHELIKELATEG